MWLIHFLNRFSNVTGTVRRTASRAGRLSAISLVFSVVFSIPALTEPAPVVGILLFKPAAATADKTGALYWAVMSAARNETAFNTVKKNTHTLWYDYDMAEIPSSKNLSWYTAICGYLRSTHLLMGRVHGRSNAIFIESKLFSAKDKKFAFTVNDPVPTAEDFKKAAGLIVKRVSLYCNGKLPFITNIKASRGSSIKHVSLSWICNPAADTTALSRSQYEGGPFIKIGETDSNNFIDAEASEGIKYWYMVRGTAGGIQGVPAVEYGYRKPEISKGLTVSEMLDPRNKPRPVPATPEGNKKEKLHLALFDKYCESYILTTFISLVGRFYINSGELIAYRDFRLSSWDPANRTIYFEKPGVFSVKFFSRRFFRFIRDMNEMKIPYEDLLPRVIKNGVIFCIPSGEKEIKEPDGRIRFIPNFEAVAMGTEYTRDYEYWKSNSIFFATSDEEIYKKIKEVQMRGY